LADHLALGLAHQLPLDFSCHLPQTFTPPLSYDLGRYAMDQVPVELLQKRQATQFVEKNCSYHNFRVLRRLIANLTTIQAFLPFEHFLVSRYQ
uniref:Uncharacterized protein n=1 Tax=Romanomermis culicivorax TaxID=13658 RepID=A0A915HIB6_ROMCU